MLFESRRRATEQPVFLGHQASRMDECSGPTNTSRPGLGTLQAENNLVF